MYINDNIKKIREKRGLSQQEIAALIGEKRSSYAEWEGSIAPKIDVFIKIARALEMSLDDLSSQDIDNVKQPDMEKSTAAQDGNSVPWKDYVDLLKEHNKDLKESLSQKEADIAAYRKALNSLTDHDERIKKLESLPATVDALKEKVATLEAIVPAYQEWLLEEFVLLNPKRGAKIIEDALGKQLVAHGIKGTQKGTPKHSGK